MPHELLPYYDPWVGANYWDSPFSGNRLLIVGESSYERVFKSGPDHICVDTQTVADGKFPTKYAGFWSYIQRSLTGTQHISTVNQNEFWNGVALVNLVQRPMASMNDRPSSNDLDNGSKVLGSYIKKLEPSGVIVFSKISWDSLISALDLKKTGDEIVPDNTFLREDFYPYNQVFTSRLLAPKSPRFLMLRHPRARPSIAGREWHNLIKPYLTQLHG